MAIVDNPNENQEANLSGAAPLAQGQGQAQGAYDQAAGQNTGQALQTGGTGSQGGSQGGTTNKKSKKASSGMFTNIQNYVEKNKPQAQKMAGAVNQDFSKQAGEIRKVAEEKSNQQANLIGNNQNLMTQGEGQARAAVDNIMGAPTVSAQQQGVTGQTQQPATPPVAADASTFQDLASGKIKGYNDVGALNLSEQKNRMAALGQLAQGANTEQGRRNLLGNTFSKQGQYSRGMSGLDNLITSGSQAARESLITGTQGQADTLKGDLGEFGRLGQEALNAQNDRKSKFADTINKMRTDAVTGIESGITAKLDDLKKLSDSARGELGSSFGAGGDYNIPQEVLQALGLNANTNLYGTDIGAYYNNLAADPSAANAMSADQAAKLQGLAKLGNVESDYSMVNPDDVSEFGLGSLFDTAAFKDSLGKNKAAWEAEKLPQKQEFMKFKNEESSINNRINKLLNNSITAYSPSMNQNDVDFKMRNNSEYQALKNQLAATQVNKNNALQAIYGSNNQGGGTSGGELLTGTGKSNLDFGNLGKGITQASIDALLKKQAGFKTLNKQAKRTTGRPTSRTLK